MSCTAPFTPKPRKAMLLIEGAGCCFAWNQAHSAPIPHHDVAVGRHVPPNSDRVAAFMQYFAKRYRLEPMGKGGRIVAMAAAHHRLNYMHPFPDGNGRVSRLMSHAMGLSAGIGASGLSSCHAALRAASAAVRRYRRMMDYADMPGRGDLDDEAIFPEGTDRVYRLVPRGLPRSGDLHGQPV